MADLLELYTIEANSKLAPDQAEPVEVTQARQLRNRLRVAAANRASAILASAASLPTESEARTAELEKIAWARDTARAPDAAADVLLRLALAAHSGLSVTQILGASDTALEDTVTALVPRLAKGLRPGR